MHVAFTLDLKELISGGSIRTKNEGWVLGQHFFNNLVVVCVHSYT